MWLRPWCMALCLAALTALAASCREQNIETQEYPWHERVMTTVFWIGEPASDDNRDISNADSIFDSRWMEHYGGVDDPVLRSGHFPRGFKPEENPFYAALPYSDIKHGGGLKASAKDIPWYAGEAEKRSLVKNRWLEIRYKGRSCFAQWEDAGPFGEDDVAYVFGNATPRNAINRHAGLDISPAVRDCLTLSGNDYTDWRFVNDGDVPEGPWTEIVTES